MILRNIRLHSFRNHRSSNLEFGAGANVLVGRNGQGKTNILEAVSCLSLTKSFYAAHDASLVQIGQDECKIDGTFVNDAGISYAVAMNYSTKSGEKTFTINSAPAERLSSVIGVFPIVVLSPENAAITFGAPADRRRFMDLVLSQLSRSYLEDLLEYRKILRHRNRLLADARQRSVPRNDILEPWNVHLADYGARLIHRRGKFLEEFIAYVGQSYRELTEGNETPTIHYRCSVDYVKGEEAGSIVGKILSGLDAKRTEEYRRGVSLVGPHRDDLEFMLNGIDLQKFASQGQHKTFLVALKIAEFLYLKEKREEAPVLLFDDVLSELDAGRSERLLSHLAGLGQAIVTTTDATPFNSSIHWGYEHRKFHVEQGTCKPVGSGKEAAVGT